MRAVLVDPRSRRVILIPGVEDVHRLALTRVGVDNRWSICQEEANGQPGLLLCSDEVAVVRPGQRFFRLARCTTTFAGPSLFLGSLMGRVLSVPEWFWSEVSRKVIWMPDEIMFLGWENVKTPVVCPETGRRTEEVISRPVYGREGGLGP